MKCFPRLPRVRRGKCLLLAVSLIALINLICMTLWKIGNETEEEFELVKLELTFARKQKTVSHTLLTRPWHSKAAATFGQRSTLERRSSTVLPKKEKKSTTPLAYNDHTSYMSNQTSTDTRGVGNVNTGLRMPEREVKSTTTHAYNDHTPNRSFQKSTDTLDIGYSNASTQWLATQKEKMPTPKADHDHVHKILTIQDYIELDNTKVINKDDNELPVSRQVYQSEKEAVRACELANEQCKAIFKLKDHPQFFTLGSEFILFSDRNSTLYVKPKFLSSLEFSDTEVNCGVSPTKIQPHNFSGEVGCRLPDIDPFEASSMKYFQNRAERVPLVCDREATLFTRYRDGLLEVVTNHDRGAPVTDLSFQTIHREASGSDTGFRLGVRTPLKYKGPVLKLNHDFIQVNAEFFNGMTQTDFHAQVVPKRDVLRRKAQQKPGIPLNIIILGLDQTSHATFQRLLTSSYKFLRDELQAFMFKGFSLVGEGTTPQLTALLTGRTVEENCKMHEARTGFAGAGTVDEWPFIFKTLKKHGYATMFSEDAPPIGAFNMRLEGFKKPPCDHYARPFWSAVPHELNAGVLHEMCISSQPQHKLQLEYLKSLFRAYPKIPKFGFIFLSSLCHHKTIMPLGAAEKDFYEFFKSIRDSGGLNDTMLVVMGDHGARTGSFRSTMQGKLEERLPMLSIALPDNFRLKYPELVKNFKLNTDVIISPLDVHATFMHVLKYPKDPSQSDLTRGLSLFSKIPRNRTCQHAKIPEYFCPCVQWLPLNITHAHIRISVLRVAEHINSLLAKDPKVSRLCERLTVDAILSAWQEKPSAEVQTFIGIQDGDGLGVGAPEFTNSSKPTECNYQVKFRTKPGYGVFEASVKLIEGLFVVNEHISRINLYGTQPDCIKNSHPHLREFCYCGHEI